MHLILDSWIDFSVWPWGLLYTAQYVKVIVPSTNLPAADLTPCLLLAWLLIVSAGKQEWQDQLSDGYLPTWEYNLYVLCDCRPPTDCLKQGLVHWIQMLLASVDTEAFLFSLKGSEFNTKLILWWIFLCCFYNRGVRVWVYLCGVMADMIGSLNKKFWLTFSKWISSLFL